MTADDPVEVLARWEAAGALWRVVERAGGTLTVALCQCDGGAEVSRVTSADPRLVDYVGDRSASDD